ncbi:MAG: hypothetical protein COA78_31165 [Blastopirellula sp.]|nr:MAG: hypothetical protein COA78_31165 [Blastopirellula sp.]
MLRDNSDSTETPAEVIQAQELLSLAADEQELPVRLQQLQQADKLCREALSANPELQSAKLLLYATLSLKTAKSGEVSATERTELQQLPQTLSAVDQTVPDLFAAGNALLEADQINSFTLIIQELRSRENVKQQLLLLDAKFYWRNGEGSKATNNCQALIKLNNKNVKAWKLLANIYQEQHQVFPLIEVYKQLVTLSGNSSSYYRSRLVSELVNLGETDQAREHFNLLVEQDASSTQTNPMIEVNLLRLEGKNAEALVKVNSILQADPENLDAYMGRAQISIVQEDFKTALADLTILLRNNPYNDIAHYEIAKVYNSQGKTDLSEMHNREQNLIKSSLIKIPFLEQHLNDNPNDVEKLTELAQRYQAVGRLDEAQALQQYLSQPK